MHCTIRYLLFVLLFSPAILVAQLQNPPGFNYQAVARFQNTILVNDTFDLRLSIYGGPGAGTLLYEETHVVFTNQYGLFNVTVGNGVPTGSTVFTDIDWTTGDHAMGVEIDNGGGYISLGIKPFWSVPFATHSNTAFKATDMSAGDLKDVDTTGLVSGNILKWNGLAWVPAQDNGSAYVGGAGIIITGNTISNTGDTDPADDITVGAVASGDLSGTYPSPVVSSIQGTPVSNTIPNAGNVLKFVSGQWIPASDEVTDPDSDPTNEIQTLSLVTNTLSLSAGGGSVNLPTYTAGAGLNILGYTIINTGDTDPNDDITVATPAAGDLSGIYPSPTVTGIQGFPVAMVGPNLDEVLKWNGTAWTPGTDLSYWTPNSNDISYSAGNVGVGTNTPVTELSVNGTTTMVNASGDVKVMAGVNNNEGFVNIYDGANTLKAGMRINASGQGEVFADVKNFRIPHPELLDKEIWYASLEGPEAAAYVRGTARLNDGKITVDFPEHFQLLANPDNMTVMLTPLSADSKGLAVVEKSSEGFMVKELHQGTGNYSFDWEVKCVRKGHENFEVIRDK